MENIIISQFNFCYSVPTRQAGWLQGYRDGGGRDF